MTKALLIKAEGDAQILNLPESDSLSVLQESVGGWIDVVRHRSFGIVAYVNDEGLIHGLRPNVSATLLFGQLLVGDVVLVGSLNSDGEYDGDNHDLPYEFLNFDFVCQCADYNTYEVLVNALTEVRDSNDWSPTVVAEKLDSLTR